MNIVQVMTDVMAAVDTIPNVRVHPFWVDRIVPPAAIPGWPARGTYDSTYARGMDQATLPVILIVGKAEPRTASNALHAYLAGTGASSVKAAIEGYDSAAWDVAHVQGWEVDVINVASVAYLAAEFTVMFYGPGS